MPYRLMGGGGTTALSGLTTDVSLSSVAQGDLFYRGATAWNNLAAGAAGAPLVSGGAAANPAWAANVVVTTDLVAQYRSTNAQVWQIFNTRTDASNYERLAIQWVANLVRIETENAGTGSDRAMLIKSRSTLTYETANSGDVVIKPNGSQRANFTGAGGLTLDVADGALRINNQTTGAGAETGTLENAPSAGDPAFWLPINIAGTIRYCPLW